MNEFKNKSTILIIVALIVVCGGSFIGVRALGNSVDSQTTVAPVVSYAPQTTTAPSTTAYVAPETSATASQQPVLDLDVNIGTPSTQAPTSSSANLITTFAMVPGATTTQGTTIVTTAAPTTTTTPSTKAPVADATTKQTTTKSSQNSNLLDKGLAGYLFNADGKYYFTSDDPWQRNFGYNEAFDTAAPFVSIYMDTMRVKFRYDNKDWMIQFWKGQYGLAFIGSEIGVYTKPLDRTMAHYDAASDEDALYMACTCYRNNQVLFSREYAKYWWCTGFVPGQLEKFSDRSELAVKCRITMKDSAMLLAVCNALKAAPNNLVEGKHYTVSGLDVFITWQ